MALNRAQTGDSGVRLPHCLLGARVDQIRRKVDKENEMEGGQRNKGLDDLPHWTGLLLAQLPTRIVV
jgi:hypothetical protein